MNCFQIILVLMAVLALAKVQEVKKIEGPARIGEIGLAKLVTSRATVLVYTNLEPYGVGLRNVKAILDNCIQYCNNSSCRTTVDQLNINYVELESKWQQVTTVSRKRTKRGLLNIGGEFLKFMIGTLSEEDGRKYEKAILQNEFNLQRTSHQSSLNKKIIASLLNAELTTRGQVNQQTESISQILSDEEFSESAHQATLMMMNLGWQIQKLVMHLVVDSLKFHETVIPAEQVESALRAIKAEAATFETLPFDQWCSAYYSITSVHLALTPMYAIYEVKFPLVLAGDWKAYKIQPVPMKTNRGYSMLAMEKKRYRAVRRFKLHRVRGEGGEVLEEKCWRILHRY